MKNILFVLCLLLTACTAPVEVNVGTVQKMFPTGIVLDKYDQSLQNVAYLVQFPNGEVRGYTFRNGKVKKDIQFFRPVK